jgi:hypothetical protein
MVLVLDCWVSQKSSGRSGGASSVCGMRELRGPHEAAEPQTSRTERSSQWEQLLFGGLVGSWRYPVGKLGLWQSDADCGFTGLGLLDILLTGFPWTALKRAPNS